MYSREVNGQELTFGVSGKLIMNGMVMYDHQTDSLWAQVIGVSVQGEFSGTKLDFVPAVQTTWGTWLKQHPDTLVLDKGGYYLADPYRSYYAQDYGGIIRPTNIDDRLTQKEFVVGVTLGDAVKAYPFRTLNETPAINDTVGGTEIVVDGRISFEDVKT